MARRTEDPVLRSSRREAVVALLIWLCAMTYTVGYCYQNGYERPLDSITFVFGFPDWVFWGILVPWTICILISFWFSTWFMKDEDLGPEADSAELTDGSNS